ncbi:MAG: carboxymuconolactone decarboxylase family protein [Pseudomonadota bacterium]
MKSLPDTLAHSDYLAATAKYAEWAPKPLAAFEQLAQATFTDGALSTKEKELIAVACSHVVRCAYCIDYHVGLATDAGASEPEISESIWVGITLAAGACFSHSDLAARRMKKPEKDYYPREKTPDFTALASANPAAYAAYVDLNHAAFQDGEVPARLKRLTAIACAHNTRCPMCIEHHVSSALEAGEEKPAIAEAIWVAIEIGAGASFGHAGLAAALMATK